MRAVQTDDGITEGGEGSPDLAIPPLMHRDVPSGFIAFVKAFDIKPTEAVIKHDAVVLYHLAMKRLQGGIERYFVNLILLPAGVGQPMCQLAVICE